MKIVIAGFGVEGRANFEYFRLKFPMAELVIADENVVLDAPDGVEVRAGEEVFLQPNVANMVVRTAGLAPRKIKTNAKVWSATNEFFAECPASIIGVTGTKGKGTTCSLIASILRAAGQKVHLVGNIGTPALEILPKIKPDDIVVYELSSFQLWDLERSPHIAVVLMIEPDHLDVHESFEEYLTAKKNIRKYQTLDDICLYHPTNTFSEEVAGSIEFEADYHCETCAKNAYRPGSFHNAHRYAVSGENQVYVEDGYFCVQNRKICSTDNLRLPGAHNLENACAAISAVAELADWQKTITDEAVAQGLRDFTGLPHRLKFVAEKNGVKYYDDSIATTPGSAIAALRSFDAPKTIILGGSDKGASYGELAAEIVGSNMRVVILIGDNAAKIYEALISAGVNQKYIENLGRSTMTEIVDVAQQKSKPGDIVILSPASASFGMFKNYADRGEQFVEAAKLIKNKEVNRHELSK